MGRLCLSPCEGDPLGEKMIEIRLRQSWINTFLSCPEKARQERYKLVKQKESSDLLRGNAVHAALEFAGGSPSVVELEDLHQLAEDYVHTYSSEVEVWRHEYDKLLDTVMANISVWYSELYIPGADRAEDPLLPAVSVEEPFEKSLGTRGNINLILTGTADWVAEDGVIWDWKNPSRFYEPWEKKRWDIQSHAYCYALDKTEFKLCVLANGQLQIIEIERTEQHKNAFLELCWSMVPTIMSDAETWPQNWEGYHCSPLWCPVWQAGKCRGEHLGENPW